MDPDEAVSVVIPTKDRGQLLQTAVASVLAQVGVDVHVVVVDDGSATPAATHLANDPRLHWLRHETSRGVSQARNAGLGAVGTPWVAFLDDDDLWSPLKLRRQLEALATSGHAWACSASVQFCADEVLGVSDPPAADDVSEAVLRGNPVPGGGSGVLVRTALLRAVGGFDAGLASLADWDCWIRLAQESPVARVQQPDVGYRIGAGGMAHDVGRQEAELERMTVKYASFPRPLHLRPDAVYSAYLARLEYRAGNWARALPRTRRLVTQHRHLHALLMPVRELLPAPVQRAVRRRQLTRRAVRRPDQDWSWLSVHLADRDGGRAPTA